MSTVSRFCRATFLVGIQLWTATVASAVLAQNANQKADYRNPPREYQRVTIDERMFIVEKQLLEEDPAVAQRAIVRLKNNIDLALSILPQHSHRQIAKQRFYVMYGPKAKGGGKDNGLAYMRPGSPKFNKTRDEDWNSVVVVWNAENYMKLTDLWALKSVLHELSHAYQLEQWPEKQPDIVLAYENAMASKLYHDVKNNKGGTFKTAYATVNQLEYFAEVSCMFFAQCNYQPFDRQEFKAYDPAGYEMVRKLWKIGDEHGKHEQRTWHSARDGRTLNATFKSATEDRITLIDADGKERTTSFQNLSEIDQDYIRRWFAN